MTRGYFVMEKAGKVLKAAELSSDAYLQNGYGEQILTEYRDGKAEEFLDSLTQADENIHPGWYRKVKGVNSDFAEYAYVLRSGNLTVYHFGKKLFTVTPGTADKWLSVVQRQDAFENHFLYSEELLNYNWKKWDAMFPKINEMDDMDIPSYEEKICLNDFHMMDCWYREKSKAYVKTLELPNGSMKFIVAQCPSKWHIYLQLPYIRIPVLLEYSSERAAMNNLRDFIRKVPVENLTNFVFVFQKWGELMEKLREREISFEEAKREIDELEGDWLFSHINFSKAAIISSLRRYA